MKIISWNVNGIRSAVKHGAEKFVTSLQAEFYCFQEVKAEKNHVVDFFPGYFLYCHSAQKKGYSGTITLAKKKPEHVFYGMGIEKHDREGRILTLEYPRFYLVNVYTPHSKRGLLRLGYRIEEWDKDFLIFLKELEQKKPVIFCGDLNVAHQEIDLANPKSNRKNPGFTDQERNSFSQLLDSGFIDSYRYFDQSAGKYTWWSQRPGVRERNIGWRIDYICVSERLKNNLKSAEILPTIYGSDHCPISIEIEI